MTRRFVRSDRLAFDVFPLSRSLATGILAAVLAGWAAWFFFADVPVSERSLEARLEAAEPLREVQAPAEGPIAEFHMRLGRHVEPGSLLVVIEDESLRHELAELQARLSAVRDQRASLVRSASSESESLQAASRADELEAESIQEQLEGRRALLDFLERESRRVQAEYDAGLISLEELERQSADLAGRRSEVNQSQLSLEHSRWQHLSEEMERRADIDVLQHDRESLEGEQEILEAKIAGVRHAIELRHIRSSIAGRIVDIVPLAPGAVVTFGQRMGTIVPEGELRIIAFFDPAVAVGRIHPGQKAELRLDGFPWLEYGVIEARLDHVASEPRDGKLRTELTVVEGNGTRPPMQHGMPGQVHVEIERTSPAKLVLRAAGLVAEPAGRSPGRGRR